MKNTRWIVFNDNHIPYQDVVCEKLLLGAIKRIKPDGIAVLGDLIDCYSVSKFATNPNRITQIRDDIRQGEEFLDKVRNLCPDAKIWFLEGNHEERLRKYIWTKAPELSGFEELELVNLLKLKEKDIKYFQQPVKEYTDKRNTPHLGDLYLYHGSVIRKHAGYSARAMYEAYGVSLICGHTHRDGKYTIRTERGHFAAWENYCLCKLNPRYMKMANWTQGFSVVTVIGKRPYVEQIPIINGKYIYGGKMYS